IAQAGGEDGQRLAVDLGKALPVAIWRWRKAWRARDQAAERCGRAQRAVGEPRSLPHLDHRALPQRLATSAAVLEDLPRQRDVDGANLLARIALGAKGVGEVGVLEAVVEGGQDQPDRPVVGVAAELMAADGH